MAQSVSLSRKCGGKEKVAIGRGLDHLEEHRRQRNGLADVAQRTLLLRSAEASDQSLGKDEVRRLYAGPGGAILKTLSFLSLHVPLSEQWLRDRVFDLRGAKRILDAGCGAGQLTRHLARYADSNAAITACDFSFEMLLRARQ